MPLILAMSPYLLLLALLTLLFSQNDCPDPLALLFALLWLCSFLTNCSLSVVFGPTRTAWAHNSYGLPQDSDLASLLHILFTVDLAGILLPLGTLSHQYADDMQTNGLAALAAPIDGQMDSGGHLSSGLLDAFMLALPQFRQDIKSQVLYFSS